MPHAWQDYTVLVFAFSIEGGIMQNPNIWMWNPGFVKLLQMFCVDTSVLQTRMSVRTSGAAMKYSRVSFCFSSRY